MKNIVIDTLDNQDLRFLRLYYQSLVCFKDILSLLYGYARLAVLLKFMGFFSILLLF